MKKNLYKIMLPILLVAMAGCSNAENINSPALPKTHDAEVALSQTQTLEVPQSKLNCAQFNLDFAAKTEGEGRTVYNAIKEYL